MITKAISINKENNHKVRNEKENPTMNLMETEITV